MFFFLYTQRHTEVVWPSGWPGKKAPIINNGKDFSLCFFFFLFTFLSRFSLSQWFDSMESISGWTLVYIIFLRWFFFRACSQMWYDAVVSIHFCYWTASNLHLLRSIYSAFLLLSFLWWHHFSTPNGTKNNDEVFLTFIFSFSFFLIIFFFIF